MISSGTKVVSCFIESLCCTETIEAKVPIPLKRIMQDDRLWQALVAVCLFTAPAMMLLRVTDRKKPGMDKIKYFSSKMERYMIDNAAAINEMFVSPDDPCLL